MLEHPEIGWIERTGYPSWLQEHREDTLPKSERRKDDEQIAVPMGIQLLTAAGGHQRLRKALLPTPAQTGRQDPGVSS